MIYVDSFYSCWQAIAVTVKDLASMGGIARAKKLSPERRSEIAKLASLAAKAAGKLTGRPKKSFQILSK